MVEPDKTTVTLAGQACIVAPGPDNAPHDQIKANARLIAAAPDLLVTLQRLASLAAEGVAMRHETGKPTWSFIDEVKTRADEAINKATTQP